MEKLLTVAIPAYNMEKYIGRCLDSITNIKNTQGLEILIINDGSKDNTLTIAQEYEKRYPNIIKVIDKPNGGWGTAINKAIELATGKYFKILDSDDWFETKAFSEFLQLLDNINVDLVATSFSYEYASGTNKSDIYPLELCNHIIPFSEYLRTQHHNKHLPMATITFKTKLLQDNHIQVAEKYYADIEYNLIPLIYVKNIFFSQLVLYKYWIGREGQSTSLAGYNTHLDDFLRMSKRVVSFYKSNVINGDIDTKKMYKKDLLNILRFSYYLLLSPQFAGEKKESISKCSNLDIYIKQEVPDLYKLLNRVTTKKIIPYIFIWRITKINVLKLRTWI